MQVAVSGSLVLVAGLASGAREAPAVVLLYLALISVALCRVDLREHRLPNSLVVPGFAFALVGLVWQGVGSGTSPMPALVGGIVYAGVLLGPALAGAAGMGDVKLGGVLGLALGSVSVEAVVLGPVIAFVVGGVAGLVALSVPGARGSDELPFGPFMIGGFWVAVAAAG